jgi:hypothetical protein
MYFMQILLVKPREGNGFRIFELREMIDGWLIND